MPLSFAAILGGCATLIGTSTNLIVNGLVVDQEIIPGLASLDIFDFVWVGVPMIVFGFFYLVYFANRLLPDKPDLLQEFTGQNRTFYIEAEVRKKSHLIGTTIEESGLRNLRGLYLVEILRNERRVFVVSNNMVIEEGDMLIFAGDREPVAELMKNSSGLTLPSVGMLSRKKHTEIVEIVISHNSNLIGKNLKNVNFRAMYDAAVIGVHRNEETISGKLKDVVLKAGDVLLLSGGGDFLRRSVDTQDFYFISRVQEFKKMENYKVIVLVAGLLAAIILSALNVISLFLGLLVLIILSLIMGMTNPKDLPRGIDYSLALIIVMSLALGTAMIKSGAAQLIAAGLIQVFMPLGNVGILFGIYFITALLAAYITNKAAVAIIFPISLTISVNLGLDPFPFILVVGYAAAANFITPHGYQTNLMIYGPGGYTYKDFFRVGTPLTLIYMIVAVIILSLLYL
jgi:di/tricarboxylate transporter